MCNYSLINADIEKAVNRLLEENKLDGLQENVVCEEKDGYDHLFSLLLIPGSLLKRQKVKLCLQRDLFSMLFLSDWKQSQVFRALSMFPQQAGCYDSDSEELQIYSACSFSTFISGSTYSYIIAKGNSSPVQAMMLGY